MNDLRPKQQREFWEQFVPYGYELKGFTGTTSVTFQHRHDARRVIQLEGAMLQLFIQMSLENEERGRDPAPLLDALKAAHDHLLMDPRGQGRAFGLVQKALDDWERENA